MRVLLKILFWIYFSIATVSFIIVLIYLFNHYPPFLREQSYKSKVALFEAYFTSYEKPDTTFISLFNNNSEIAINFLNETERAEENVKFKSKAVNISKADLSDLDSLIKHWPVKYQEIVKENLLGIFILDSSRFNGLTQIVHPTEDSLLFS